MTHDRDNQHIMRLAYFVTVLILIVPIRLFSQDKTNNILINFDSYKGTLFEENYEFVFPNKNDTNIYSVYSYIFGESKIVDPWTPQKTEIIEIDSRIKKTIKKAYRNLDNIESDSYKYIIKNLSDYNRQFIGYIENGNKMLYINFYYKKIDKENDEPDKIMQWALGGGVNYFDITINLSKSEAIDFNINAPE
jgi:hypothetical protein